jgi:tRNA(adenine34) deaminase
MIFMFLKRLKFLVSQISCNTFILPFLSPFAFIPITTLFADEYFMRQALQESQQAFQEGEIPAGAVVISQNRMIARTHNLIETLTDVTAHTEMQAITSAADFLAEKYLNECTLHVTLKPCIMCAGALGWLQIGNVVYGASDEKRGFRTFAPAALSLKTGIVFCDFRKTDVHN